MSDAARRAAGLAGAGLLAAASVLHAGWAAGASWPARSRSELGEVVAGLEEPPGPAACLLVAGALATGAGLVATRASGHVGRTGRAGVAAVLAVKGVAGTTGRTERLVPWTPSQRFVVLDRRVYGPLCLAVAALVASDLPAGRGRAGDPR